MVNEIKNEIKINEKLARKIINAMFINFNFDFEIDNPDDDIIYFTIKSNDSNVENNQIELLLEKNKRQENLINISVHSRIEDYKFIGWYNTIKNYFIPSNTFWEIMFLEHLKFCF